MQMSESDLFPETNQTFDPHCDRAMCRVQLLELFSEMKQGLEGDSRPTENNDLNRNADEGLRGISNLLKSSVTALQDYLKTGPRSDEDFSIAIEFTKILSLTSSRFSDMKQQSNEDIDAFNSHLEDGISSLNHIVTKCIRALSPTSLVDICENISDLCLTRERHSMRQYVALVKIFTQLMEKADTAVARSVPTASSLIHHMGRKIELCLASDSEHSSKLISFLSKRIVLVSEKCAHVSSDRQFIAVMVRLNEFRFGDENPLSRTIERLELYKLIQPKALSEMPNNDLGIGFVLVCCDICETLLESREDDASLERLLRALYDHVSDIFQFMFHRSTSASHPLFDRCLSVVCRGLLRTGANANLLLINESNSADEHSFERRLFRDEVRRCLDRSKRLAVDHTEMFKKLESSTSSTESRNALKTFFQQTLDALPATVDSSQVRIGIIPCSPNSALLSSLTMSLRAENASKSMTPHQVSQFTAEQIEILAANPDNDCIFLAACALFSYLRDFDLNSIENVSYQAPVVKLRTMISRTVSNNAVMSAFAAAAILAFTFGADLSKWLTLNFPAHREYFEYFANSFSYDQWSVTLESLRSAKFSPLPINSYSSRDAFFSPVLKLSKEPLVNELFKIITRLESLPQPNLIEEDCQILKLCLRKVEKLLRQAQR